MIDYRFCSVEEMASDEAFRQWVIAPDAETDAFWHRWVARNPDREHVVSMARELVITVHELYKADLPDEMLAHELAEIVRIAEQRKNARRWLGLNYGIWKAAAAVVLTAGLALAYYSAKPLQNTPATVATRTSDLNLMITRTNRSETEMTVLLSDNSVATLAKGSAIRFPKKFSGNERRVYLTGEAFFDVSRNENQPFLVYTNETVTKVLGTSFRIKAFDEESEVLVAVKTGKVSVFQKNEYEQNASNAAKPGVILSPNQQAVFNRKAHSLQKAQVSNPQMLAESAFEKNQFIEDQPVGEVLQTLQKLYGIEIQYNAEKLANCRINAQFDDENLKQRMNAICQAIGASYEMVDGQLVINSKGCI